MRTPFHCPRYHFLLESFASLLPVVCRSASTLGNKRSLTFSHVATRPDLARTTLEQDSELLLDISFANFAVLVDHIDGLIVYAYHGLKFLVHRTVAISSTSRSVIRYSRMSFRDPEVVYIFHGRPAVFSFWRETILLHIIRSSSASV